MEVLFAAAEAAPFAKTGGLGDVIGSLPSALQKENIKVRVIMPLYGDIPLHFKDNMATIGKVTVPLAWRRQPCALKRLDCQGITFYFVDNEYYFKRTGLYGFADDTERFAFFCRAVLESLPYMDFTPRVLHCHDWHTGLISVFLQAFYSNKSGAAIYDDLRTVLTIHNVAYQGVCGHFFLGDALGLGDEYYTEDRLKFNGGINFLKGGICFSDMVTTVSRTYSQEIKTPCFGEKLDPVLQKKGDSLLAVINGLDYDLYDPWTDPAISCNYRSSLKKRARNKLKLQEILGLEVNENTPLLAVVSRLVEHKGFDLFKHILEEILQMNVQLAVLGKGEERYEKMFLEAAHKFPGQAAARIMFDETLARQVYAGSDLFLMPSRTEPCGLGQLIALRYGSVPVVRETGGLKDTVRPYDEKSGSGNGFTFKEFNAGDFLFAVKKALGYYERKDIWPKIVKNALKADYSWKEPAREYSRLYTKLQKTGR